MEDSNTKTSFLNEELNNKRAHNYSDEEILRDTITHNQEWRAKMFPGANFKQIVKDEKAQQQVPLLAGKSFKVETPVVEKRFSELLEILSVEFTSDFTLFELMLNAEEYHRLDGKLRINPQARVFYHGYNNEMETGYVMKVDGAPLGPEEIACKSKSKPLLFTLFFPPHPAPVRSMDLLIDRQPEKGNMCLFQIRINKKHLTRIGIKDITPKKFKP